MAWSLTDLTTSVDLTAECDASSLAIASRAYGDTSRLSATILDEGASISILTEHEMLVMDGANKAFAGFVRVRNRTDRGSSGHRVYQIECQDYTTLLGDDVADTSAAVRTNETDKARITALFTAFGTRGIVIGASVVQLRATMPDFDYTGLTLHECLTQICGVTGGSFYVDYNKTLHYYSSEAISAPFALSDNPDGVASFGYDNFTLRDDSAQLVNAVFVIGSGISGWRPSSATVASLRAAGTLRAMTIRDSEITDVSTLNAVGDAALATYGNVRQPSSLVTYRPGLVAGMNVQVTHAGWGVSAVTYRIASIEARPVDANRIAYTVYFGSNPISLGELMRQTQLAVAEATVQAQTAASVVVDLSAGGGNLVPNSSFEDGTYWTVGGSWVIGVSVADAFHGTDEARYTPSASSARLETGFITVDRADTYFASAWIQCRAFTSGRLQFLVEEYDASNALLATTVIATIAAVDTKWNRYVRGFAPAASLSVTGWQAGTAKVKLVFSPNGVNATGTWSVDGVQLERGGMVTAYAPLPQEIVDGSIQTTDISDNAITTPKLVAGAVVTGKIAAGAITSPLIAASAVTADKIAAGAILVGHFGEPVGQLISNPSFEADGDGALGDPITGWTVVGGSASNFETQASLSAVKSGLYSLRVVSVNGTAQRIQPTLPSRIVGNARYKLSVWTRGLAGNAAGCTAILQWFWLDSTGATVSSSSQSLVVGASTTLAEIAAIITAPATASFLLIELQAPSTNTSGNSVYFDDALVYRVDQDVSHAGGDVAIDSTGITINNGKLTFNDEFGFTTMNGRGFGSSWLRFVLNRVYNSTFDGSTSDIAVSEVGGGSGLANYAASISPSLPYWVVKNSGGNVRKVADANSRTGQALELSSGAGPLVSEVYQDVPLDGLVSPQVTVFTRGSGANLVGRMNYSWRDVNHAIIGTAVDSVFTNLATYRMFSPSMWGLAKMPTNAAYLRVSIRNEFGSGSLFVSDVRVAERRNIYVQTSTPAASTIAANSVWTKLTVSTELNGNEDHLLFDGVNTTRILMPLDGSYRITAQASWAGNAAQRRILGIGFNGAQPVADDERTFVTAGQTFAIHQVAEWVVASNSSTQYIELWASQNAAATLSLDTFVVTAEFVG